MPQPTKSMPLYARASRRTGAEIGTDPIDRRREADPGQHQASDRRPIERVVLDRGDERQVAHAMVGLVPHEIASSSSRRPSWPAASLLRGGIGPGGWGHHSFSIVFPSSKLVPAGNVTIE